MITTMIHLKTVEVDTAVIIRLNADLPFEASLENLKPIGVIFILGAATCESLFTTLSRKLHVSAQQQNTQEQNSRERAELPPVVSWWFLQPLF